MFSKKDCHVYTYIFSFQENETPFEKIQGKGLINKTRDEKPIPLTSPVHLKIHLEPYPPKIIGTYLVYTGSG